MRHVNNRGVTLLELLIVVAIIGILAAVAIPAYDGYVTRSRRSDAFTGLETARAAQEMYRAEYGFYSGALTSLAGCSSGMAGSNYTISLTRADTTNYTATAQPKEKQTGDFWFRVDQDGTQEYSSDGSTWQQGKWEELR
jgi:type IV pilus assembly protein PilE